LRLCIFTKQSIIFIARLK